MKLKYILIPIFFLILVPTLSISAISTPDPPKLTNGTITSQADIEWSIPAHNGGTGTISYNIKRSADGITYTSLANQTTLNYTDLSPLVQNYNYYRVYSNDTNGQSPGYAFPLNQTISNDILTHLTYDGVLTDQGTSDSTPTATGSEIYGTGHNGQARIFDGTNYDTMNNESLFDFNAADPFSLSFWMNATAQDNKLLISKGDINDVGWRAKIRTNALHFELTNTDITDDLEVRATGLGSYFDGQQHHVIWTYDGSGSASGVNLYLDGVNISLLTVYDTLTGSPLNNFNVTVGSSNVGSRLFTGEIDDLRIFYNYKLSASEAQQIYYERLDTPLSLPEGSATITTGNIGDTLKVESEITLTAGYPLPANATALKLYQNNTLVKTETILESIPSFGTPVSLENLWYRITDDDPHEYALFVVVTNDFGSSEIPSTINATVTREYDPDYFPAVESPSTQGQVNATVQRVDDEDGIWLKVNRIGVNTGDTWQIECITQTNSEASQTKNQSATWEGTWSNTTNTGYFNTTWTGFANSHGYVTCFNDDMLFSLTSYTNSSLALLGIQLFDESYGSMLGVPVGVFFLVMTAGMANKRTAPTFIIVVTGIAGTMATIGFFSFEPLVWGLALVTAMLGIFVNQKIF